MSGFEPLPAKPSFRVLVKMYGCSCNCRAVLDLEARHAKFMPCKYHHAINHKFKLIRVLAMQEHPIDICHVCHISRYVNEMREEYTPDDSGMSPTGYVLKLTCRECDDKAPEQPLAATKLRLVKR